MMRPSLLFALAFTLVVASCQVFAVENMPFEERDCGTIGNVLTVAGHARDHGQDLDKIKKASALALKECQEENGLDGCSIRNKEQQDFVDKAFEYLWAHKDVDGDGFAEAFYDLCKKSTRKAI